ncbi:MAG: type II toxin-antitoxin system HicB family antitoxin, partial [Acetobacterium sp.]|nr:type II toxin-antitoxin system HicB family antitoxin [Acetobacterium sp.]
MKKRYEFIAVFNYADDGISIEFPDLPGCLPCADTTDEAIKNAKEAMGLHLFGMEQDGDEIPNPTPLEKIHLEKGDIPILIDVF